MVVCDAYPTRCLKMPLAVWSRGEVDSGALCVRTCVGRCAPVCGMYIDGSGKIDSLPDTSRNPFIITIHSHHPHPARGAE